MARQRVGSFDHILSRQEKTEDLGAQHEALLRHWSKHPWNFLTGKDLDGTPIIRTADEADNVDAIKPLPADWEYLSRVCYYFFQLPPWEPLWVDKTRQLMISTLALLTGAWFCAFIPQRRFLVSKNTEDEAKGLLERKVADVFERMPEWVKESIPVALSGNRIDFPNTKSEIIGCTANAAERQARGGTASILLIDEAAFQADLPSLYSSALTMCPKIWVVSTNTYGNPGADLFSTTCKSATEPVEN